MKELDPNWQTLIDTDPFWIWSIQSAEKPFGDINQLLYWFDQGSITLEQLEDGLEEYEYHNDVRYSLVAMRHNPLVLEEVGEEQQAV